MLRYSVVRRVALSFVMYYVGCRFLDPKNVLHLATLSCVATHCHASCISVVRRVACRDRRQQATETRDTTHDNETRLLHTEIRYFIVILVCNKNEVVSHTCRS